MQMGRLSPLAVLLAASLLTACDAESPSPDFSATPADLTTTLFDGGIGCGTIQCPLTSTSASVCCILPSGEYCAPAEACSAGIPAYCDGPEDCFGATCCQVSGLISCTTQCQGATLCHIDQDCPPASPRCCGNVADAGGFRACAASCS
jgi:hypothetical protein